MSTERPFPPAKLKHPGHATAALAYVAGQVEHIQDLGYALLVVADEAEANLRAEHSVVGSGLQGIANVINDKLDELDRELRNMVLDNQWNPGVVVEAP